MKFGKCILTGIILVITILVLNINFINNRDNIINLDNGSNFKAYDMGQIVYSIKTPSGLFFKNRGKEYFIGGTEVRVPSIASVYIMDTESKNIIKEFKIKNTNAVWSFCETKDNIFFGTIDGNGGNGTTLYSIDKKKFNLTEIYNFKERMIYAMDYDGMNKIYIGTSEEANLYGYDISLNKMEKINRDIFTKQKIIRTLVYSNGKCYLGIGTKADLIMYDVNRNTYMSILDKKNNGESFFYDIKNINGRLVYLLSPSMKIIEYDENTQLSKEIIPKNLEGIDFNFKMYNFAGKKIFYDLQKEEYYLWKNDDLLIMSKKNPLIQGITASGIFKTMDLYGKTIDIIDLSKELEKTWEQPIEFIADDGILYFPGRRFLIYNYRKNDINVGIMNSEPQASVISSKGIYTANYTDAKVWFYPFEYLEDNEFSGSDLSRTEFLIMDIEDNQLRPYMMDISIKEKYIGIVTGPQYGQFGGALTIYDVYNKKPMFTHRNIVENHGLISISFDDKDENIVWLGTYIYGEKTSSLENESAKLVKYDIGKNKIIFSSAHINAPSIRNIIKLGKYVYCLANNEIFKIDSDNGEFVNKSTRQDIYEICLMDNEIIGISNNEIFKIDEANLKSENIMSGFDLLNNLRYDDKLKAIFVFDDYSLIKIIKTK